MADILARLRIRAGTSAAWTSANPILAAGEPGFETDTRVLRIGDGSTAFLSLQKFETSDGFEDTFQPLDDNLTAFSGLTFAANKLPYGTGIGSFALTDITEQARTFLAAADEAAQRLALELTSAAITEIITNANMSVDPGKIPSRGAVGSAIFATGGPAKRVVLTSSGLFVKGDHGSYPNDHLVLVEAWGGGAGGQSGLVGGGGGAYVSKWLRFADIPTTVSVTIGAGGAIDISGGNTTFGSILTAYGGHTQGGGGGTSQAGQAGGLGGKVGGGNAATTDNTPGENAGTDGGGGGGGRGAFSTTAVSAIGGWAVYGGGGGGGWSNTGTHGAGGVSLHGGNGGAGGAPGVAPGGGGGGNAAGARGEVRVWL